jgi:hypothetical protein
VIPAHGRHALTAICLKQLRRTCDELVANGIEASAVVIACDENLDTAREFGFATVERKNQFLSQRFNDGFQLACDPEINPRPADYAVPCGSDDWVDAPLFFDLPPKDTMVGFQQISFVPPRGDEISFVRVNYQGGAGIRIYPREVLAKVNYRPADEDRYSGCDTSTLLNLRHAWRGALKVVHPDSDARQIVDWKSPDEQLTAYETIIPRYPSVTKKDPFRVLSKIYPAEALAEMQAHYSRELVAA